MNRIRTAIVVIAGLLVTALVVAGPAAAQDRNHDGIPDRWEKRNDLSLKHKQARRDQDRDGLKNRGEFRSASNPRDDDSDDDGVEDGDENAGTITSFDGSTLTIQLFGGGTVTGTVDEATEVKCGSERDHAGDVGDDDDMGDDHGTDDQGGEDDDDAVTLHGDDDGGHHSGVSDDDEDEDHVGPGRGGDDDEEDCTIDDLVVGAVVHEADLDLENGEAVFDEIELAD